jgi:hypothetical protein
MTARTPSENWIQSLTKFRTIDEMAERMGMGIQIRREVLAKCRASSRVHGVGGPGIAPMFRILVFDYVLRTITRWLLLIIQLHIDPVS